MLPTPNLTLDGKRQFSSFQNLKTQCAFKLAELVENHRMAIVSGEDQDEITEEFSQIKQRDMDKDGKLRIVGKDEVREAIGRSPDTCPYRKLNLTSS
jgi:phage terminase large subunit